MKDTTSLVDPEDARRFARDVLMGNGVPVHHAEIAARCLVEADLRGVDTHGCNRIPSYMKRIRQEVLAPSVDIRVEQITPVVSQIDGKNGFGFISAALGMDSCTDMAATYGIGMCSIKHSNHFGMSASFVLQAARRGMMSMVFTNSSPALPAWGGMSRLMGVSPIACGAPGDEQAGSGHFCLDMAPSVAARGKVYKALRRGEQIPSDWALDGEGRPTTDPAAALDGVMLPMGGPKGSALAIMMDVFSGVLSGSAFAGHVTGPYDPSKPADVGHFLLAIKPDLFMEMSEFKARLRYLYDRVVGSDKMPGVERIYFPGELEQECAKARETTGIPWVQAEIDAMNAEADLVGAPRIVVKNTSARP